MRTDYTCKKGDRRRVRIQLKDGAGAVVPLTEATAVKLFMRPLGSMANKIDGAEMAIEDAALGIVKYTPAAADFDTVGVYQTEIEVTFSGSETPQTFPSERDSNLIFKVDPDLG